MTGLAVECIIRAHGMGSESFVGHHDLMDLATKADFFLLPRDEKYNDYRDAISEINQRWRSNQRFMTESQLDIYLSSFQFDKAVKGNRVKYSSKRLFDLAYLVGLGVVKWNLPKK